MLAVDNTSRQTFGGQSAKLEQGVIKIILPGLDVAQQSPCLAIPIFFLDGDERYTTLQQLLSAMVDSGSLSHNVSVPGVIFITDFMTNIKFGAVQSVQSCRHESK